MRSVLLALVVIAACAHATVAAGGARKGDIIYLSTGNTLKVITPNGASRLSQKIDRKFYTRQIAVSGDGKLVFTSVGPSAGVKTNVVVNRIAGGKLGVEANLDLAVLGKGELATCSITGPGAIAVSQPKGPNPDYDFWVGVSCTAGCKTDKSQVASTNYVLKLAYNAKTKAVSSSGRILIGKTQICTPEIVDQIRALSLIDGTLYGVIAERDAQTFHYRQLLGKPHLVQTWKSQYSGECISFAGGTRSTFFALCPGRKTGFYGSGTLKKILHGKADKFLKPNRAYGRGFFNSGIATLDDTTTPLYAVDAIDNGREVILALDKNKPTENGKRVYTMPKGVSTFEIAVVP